MRVLVGAATARTGGSLGLLALLVIEVCVAAVAQLGLQLAHPRVE